VIDGIAITPRFRERQLTALHKALSAARDILIHAITVDDVLTTAEATAEYLLTLNAIKNFHTRVNPKACHDDEYRVAESKDYPDRRIPYGYAYIVPASNSDLYSTIVPISAAIAAGNCVLLHENVNPKPITKHLNSLLRNALSVESFALVVQMPFDEDFRLRYSVMLEGETMPNTITTSRKNHGT